MEWSGWWTGGEARSRVCEAHGSDAPATSPVRPRPDEWEIHLMESPLRGLIGRRSTREDMWMPDREGPDIVTEWRPGLGSTPAVDPGGATWWAFPRGGSGAVAAAGAARACAGLQDNGARLSATTTSRAGPLGGRRGDFAACGDNVAAVAGEVPVPEVEISLLDSRWELDGIRSADCSRMRLQAVYLSPVFLDGASKPTAAYAEIATSCRSPWTSTARGQVPVSLKFKLAENCSRRAPTLGRTRCPRAGWSTTRRIPAFRGTITSRTDLVVATSLWTHGWRGRHGRRRPEPPVQRPRRPAVPELEPGRLPRRAGPGELGDDDTPLAAHQGKRRGRRQPGHRGLPGAVRRHAGAHVENAPVQPDGSIPSTKGTGPTGRFSSSGASRFTVSWGACNLPRFRREHYRFNFKATRSSWLLWWSGYDNDTR